MTRRGFSALEALVSLGLSTLVIGGAAGIYAFAMQRAMGDADKAGAMSQVQSALDDISQTVSRAIHCDTGYVEGNDWPIQDALFLRCAMPEGWSDTDGQAGADAAVPSAIGQSGSVVQIAGEWVWYLFMEEGYEGDWQKRFIRVTTDSPSTAELPAIDDNPDLSLWDPEFNFVGVETWRLDSLANVLFEVQNDRNLVTTTIEARVRGAEPTDWTNQDQVVLASRSTAYSDLDPNEKGAGPNRLVNGHFSNGMSGWVAVLGGGNGLAQNYYNTPFNRIQTNWGNLPGSLSLTQEAAVVPDEIHVLSFTFGVYAAVPSTMLNRRQRLQVTIERVDTGAILDQRIFHDSTST
ncbi:MAG: hypothetical protein MH204_12055, partial [Fimbriimonadaceae bacterium]|nr:hypothetical protein [Fimbriimonadaceae bacterium]